MSKTFAEYLSALLYDLHGYDKGEVPYLDAQVAHTVKSISKLVEERIIGEDEIMETMIHNGYSEVDVDVRNQLRAEQRQERLYEGVEE